jgi:hypothetical protein
MGGAPGALGAGDLHIERERQRPQRDLADEMEAEWQAEQHPEQQHQARVGDHHCL